jgi:predicted dehydrogenase
MKRSKVRFATIGTSKITEEFISSASECDDFILTAVYSRNLDKAAQFAQKFGAPKYYHEMSQLAMDSEIDAVYIASPNSAHCHQAILLMDAGKHILCEKALGANELEVTKMLQTAKERRVILLEATRSLFDPGFQVIKENLPKIGTIRRATFRYCQYSSRYDAFLAGQQQNIFDVNCAAGALMDLGIYCVSPFIALFGEPHMVHAESILLSGGIDGAGSILVRCHDMLGELIYSKITCSDLPSEIQGESGSMQISSIATPRSANIVYQDGREEVLVIEKCNKNMKYELIYFVQAIRGEVEIKTYHHISLSSIKLMDQVRKSCGITFPMND